MAEDVWISYSSFQAILTEDLGMRCISAKLIPWMLTQEKKTYLWLLICLNIQVMKHRPAVMTLKLNSNHYDGNLYYCCYWRKHTLPVMTSCDFFYFPWNLNLCKQNIWWHINNWTQYNGAAISDTKYWIWEVLLTPTGAVEQVCRCWMSLL